MACWLGIDAGGTRSRWALLADDGHWVARGEGPGMTAMQLAQDGGRLLRAGLDALAAALPAGAKPSGVCVAMTGLGDHGSLVASRAAEAFRVSAAAVRVITDIEAACRDLFAPGAGYVVYAGTGSVAAFLDGSEVLHRAGGRGVALDDGGGGYWMAREALRVIWRREDETPGAWAQSALARAVFDQLGSTEWSRSRDFFYGSARGDVGQLALAIAKAADHDEDARAILRQAGSELARLARAMLSRFGPRPLALAGRAPTLHPLIAESFQAELPRDTDWSLREAQGHQAAARLAAKTLSSDNRHPRDTP